MAWEKQGRHSPSLPSFMDMFIYSVSNADMSKKFKIRFLCIIFFQDFWNLEITENMCHHTVVTPPHFLKKISYIIG